MDMVKVFEAFSWVFTCCISWLNCVNLFQESRQGLQSINRLNTFRWSWSVFCNMLLNTSILTSWESMSSYGDITISLLLFAQLCESVWKSQGKGLHSINRLNVGIWQWPVGWNTLKTLILTSWGPVSSYGDVAFWLFCSLFSIQLNILYFFCFVLCCPINPLLTHCPYFFF